MARNVRKLAKTKRSARGASRRDTIPRATLGRELQRQIDRFGLSRRLAAVAVGEAETQISRLMTGHFNEFSADRLVGMLNRLGSDVTISIRHSPLLGPRGRVRLKILKKP